MKIRLEHQNIGAAIMQIAEHQNFTAINPLKIQGDPINNGLLINGNIAVLCKYASKSNAIGEYVFSFKKEHIGTAEKSKKEKHNLFFALVCVEEGEICCLTGDQLNQLIESRRKSAGVNEDQYQVLVTVKKGSSFRVYVNAAGKRMKSTVDVLTIARNAFPDSIFES